MIWLIGILVVFAAAVSLWGSYDTRRDMRTGRPQYESLADFTGTWDRDQLAQLYGSPDDEDRYTVPAGAGRRLPQNWWVRCFDSVSMDCVSAGAAVAGMWLHVMGNAASVWLVAIAGLHQAIGWIIATWTVARHATFRFSDE